MAPPPAVPGLPYILQGWVAKNSGLAPCEMKGENDCTARARARVVKTSRMRLPARLLFGLLVAATLLQSVSAKKRNNGGSRKAATRKKECEQITCADVHADDAVMPRDNCVQQCLSAECYQQVYADNELEPGELDTKRSREFTQCVTKEARNNRASFSAAAGAALPEEPESEDARDGGAKQKAGASDAVHDSDSRGSVEL